MPKKPQPPSAVLTPIESAHAKKAEAIRQKKLAEAENSARALARANLTEEVLSLRIQGFDRRAIAARLSLPVQDVDAMLFEVARSFKDKQWAYYSEFLNVRLQRQESVVSKIVELVEHDDPYVRIAAYGELRKDAEGLAKMFGVDKQAVSSSINISLGGTIDPNLYKLQLAMTQAVEANPDMRQTFVATLEQNELPAIDVLPEKDS